MGSVGPSRSAFTIKPIDHGPGKKCNFGAEITGLDLNNVTDQDLETLRDAIWRHKVVVVKGQHQLQPLRNWELLERLDPDAPRLTHEEFGTMFHPTGQGIIERLRLATLPNAGLLHLMGKGYQGDDHYGIKGLDIGEAYSFNYYAKPLSTEDFMKGHTRFQSWHIDGPCYKMDPPKYSSFRTVKLPGGSAGESAPKQHVDWADGSGLSLEVSPGRTAFVSSTQLYDLLSDDEKRMADHSWFEYMYYPYQWIKDTHGNPNGLGVADEGRELSDEEMEKMLPRQPEWQKRYPMVIVNPATGEKAFQVQQNCVRRLFIRHGPSEEPKVIDDVAEVRRFLTNIQSRIIRPEYVWTGPPEEGDHLLWANWTVMHSKIDYPVEWGVRTAHQGWIPSKHPPVGPVPIPPTAC